MGRSRACLGQPPIGLDFGQLRHGARRYCGRRCPPRSPLGRPLQGGRHLRSVHRLRRLHRRLPPRRLKYNDGDGVYRPWKVDADGGPTDCTHGVKGCTMCTRACPRFRDLGDRDRHLHVRPGAHRGGGGRDLGDILLVRAADPDRPGQRPGRRARVGHLDLGPRARASSTPPWSRPWRATGRRGRPSRPWPGPARRCWPRPGPATPTRPTPWPTPRRWRRAPSRSPWSG